MERLLFALILMVPSLANAAGPPVLGPLKKEMNRVGVKMAVIMPAPSIDDYPLWSSDSRFLYSNLASHGWWKVDLNSVVMGEGKYRGHPVGVLQKGSIVGKAEDEEIKRAKEVSGLEKNNLLLKDGSRIQWEQKSTFGLQLSIKAPDKSPELLWETDLAACGYLILSPDSSMVATYCEGTGHMVLLLQ